MSGHNGDETFERWFRQHHKRLLAQCRRIVGDAAAAEDIAQETLLRAWLGRERMREEDVGAWLTVVARNLCISHVRRQKKQIPTEFLPEASDEAADPARVVERLESRRAVRRAMRGMGERQRRLLHLREFDGVDYEELSAETGLTAAGTRTVLFRARRVLRDRLAAAGEGLAAFVAGVRVKIELGAARVRQALGSVEASGASSMQAGMNFALAIGVVLSTATIPLLGGTESFGGFKAASVLGSSISNMTRGAAGSGSDPQLSAVDDADSDARAITAASPTSKLRPRGRIDTENHRQEVWIGDRRAFENHKESGHSILIEDVVEPAIDVLCDIESRACDFSLGGD